VLQKELGQHTSTTAAATNTRHALGGGLIAPALLETLNEQVDMQDLNGAIASARRYLQLGNDARALFATIGLLAARVDAAADQGHTLQIVQAASEEFIAWPVPLADVDIDSFLVVALRAATFGSRNTLVNDL
jgi:hypothetical protein